MVATLFYVESVPAAGELVTVDGDEGFHAATVRRIRPGEALALSDGAGALADCVVDTVGKRSVTARVVHRRTVPPLRPPVTVVQAIPKSERSELAVELATEAGADAIVAWQAERCVARWDGERVEKGLRRWRAVARSAARQSRRPRIPAITGPMSTPELLARVADWRAGGALVLALHESAAEPLPSMCAGQPDSVVILVGPEGGISDAEIDGLVAAGAAAVRLGPTVLRTSTAAAVALGAIGVLTPRWR
ncbi:MAG TPA: 16S rRNA (uracil(1498)-N(3))-methyltransferase [Mycobacterium sp.]|nr:16S rRNA (uracil(1498)-N(3))-methyltransferase [Mycobacterium sp.]HPZ95091.1 16S rRNA (uracil(1498)-N(3))-methyltransferase [Mycobacterium sp.]HQE15279.1 16S rRNA (uracil(1498)-N(3))-methyltransferase [Mycobacterium sp.]